MDDLEAIRRLKNGDIGGLEILITHYQAKAVRTAYLVTHEEPIAEEVVQDAFIRFYERAYQFDERRPFEPYFLKMVVYAALNAVERESRTAASLDEDGELSRLECLLACASSVEEQVEREQLKRAIHQAFGALPPRQRAAAVQRYYLDMSETEMSEALDVAPGTVKWLLNAARTRLRTLLSSVRSVE
jgi:RNA polymerase sigma-70 factor (ECF subfamily)